MCAKRVCNIILAGVSVKHIEKRRNGYYANLRVPEDIKDQIGKVRYFQSLKTTDPTVAQERVGALISKWKAEIRNARLGGLPEDREELLEQIKSERDEQPEDGFWFFDDLVSDLAIERNDPEFFAEATGRRTKTTLYLDEYLASLDDQAPKTVDAKRSDLLRFAATFKFFETITTAAAKQWLASLKLAPRTQKRIIGFVNVYWRWCVEEKGLAIEPCLKGIAKPVGSKKKTLSRTRDIYRDEDVKLLLDASRDDPSLHSLIRLAAYTGCRIEELCSLKVDNVTDDCLEIKESKTSAGVRDVPIHRDIKQFVVSLKETSSDGYLLSGLTTNKYGDRSNALGKRFGRLKTKLGFGQNHVFHCLRNTVARKFENAGVAETVAARILGHEFATMTYGLYSQGLALSAKQGAMDQISYDIVYSR